MTENNHWSSNLNEETQNIRTEINALHDLVILKWAKIVFISCICFPIAIFLSLLQPKFVADSIAILWIVIDLFLVGILGGYAMSETIRENTFKAYAEYQEGEKSG